MRTHFYAALFACLCLSGCQHNAQLPVAAQAASIPALPAVAADELQAVPEFSQLTTLTAAQQADFLAYFQHPSRQHLSAAKRIGEYMQNYLLDFQYQLTTLSASETLAQLRGNCMSLALLTHALAQLAEVEVRFQLSYREPVVDLQQGMLISVNHIRSYLLTQPAEQAGALLSAVLVDYFPGPTTINGSMLDDSRFIALLYNNLAAEAWFAGKRQQALAHLVYGLRQAPTDSLSINSLAVMLKQQGQLRAAKAWYQYGLQQSDVDLGLLQNYQLLAGQTGDQHTYQQLNQLIDRYPANDGDPFVWFNLAQRAEQQGQPDTAYHYYQRLLRRAPGFLPATQKMLQYHLQQRQTKQAQRLLETALSYSYGEENRQRYQQKLNALQQWSAQTVHLPQ